MTDNVPTPHPEEQPDTYTDLTARLAAADLGWSHEHGDPPANPDYIKRLAFQVMAFKPPLIAGVYVDDEMLDDMRDRLHGDNCGCGEWDSHSQEYVERMDETIHAVLYPLRHPARPVPQGTEDSDYRQQIAGALVPGGDQSTFGRVLDVVAPLVEQLRQARAAYNRMAGHAVDRAAERDRYYLAWQSAARGRMRARIERDTLGECMACVWCDDTGIAPEERFGRDDDGAPMMDGDQPCPKGCPVRRDIAYLLSEEKEAEQLRAALVLATAEAEDARDGGLDLAQELAEVRESRDQYHKNWDAAVAANMTALDTIGGLRADLETRTCERDYARAELDAVGRAIEGYLGVEYGTPVESARVLVERCVDAERALDGIRAERDEWWRHFLGRQRGYSDALRGMARRATALRRDRDQVHNQFLDHYNVASVQLDRVLELEEGLRERTDQRDKAVQDARGERHVRRLNELALLGQLSAERESRFRWAEEAGEMAARRDEARADAHRAARYYADQATRRATELAALRSIAVVLPEDWRQMLADGDYPEQVVDLIESWRAAPVKAETPDEHVREHDDAAPTRDQVVEEWADTWDGVDRSGLPVRPPTLAETRTGTDWCPSCRTEAGTNRYTASWGEEVIDRCATCGSRLTGASPGTGTETGE